MNRGATFQLGSSPWAREALLADPHRAAEIGGLAIKLRVRVSVLGKSAKGPWVVYIRTTTRSLRFAGHDIHETIAFGLERWAAGADDTGVRWTAGPDGLAHGHRAAGRALCGASPVSEKFRHPERMRCQACWRALDRNAVAA